jgi:hypothetical protein
VGGCGEEDMEENGRNNIRLKRGNRELAMARQCHEKSSMA